MPTPIPPDTTRDADADAPGWRTALREGAFSLLTGAVAALSTAACLALALLPDAARAGTFDDVAARAQALAARPYVAPRPATPRPVNPAASAADPGGAMSYDQYRDIRFRESKALWHEGASPADAMRSASASPFEVMFFHPGFVHTETVTIHEVVPAAGTAAGTPAATDRVIGFDTGYFDYGRNAPPAVTFDGFAGFKVTWPVNRADKRDEVVAFLGASYFRALGAGQRYGLSARGLAIDTVGGPGPEEFPRFTEFWLERPRAGATSLVIHALMDSPSVAAAYRFTVTPGAETRMDVQARLFARRAVTTLGVAPLTSMFLSGENQPRPDDFRPEVHDSDGLMVATGTGEWLWRPLANPSSPFATSFSMPRLAGFGLMQRDRRFASYEDVEARYELRPSAWVEPVGDWGPGRVELFQLPTPDETNDNVVAYWVPAAPLQPGRALDLAWTVRWQGDSQRRPPGAWVTQTRTGRSFAHLAADERQFVLDFEGPALAPLTAEGDVQAVASTDANGRVREATAYRNEATGGWRLALRVQQIDPSRALELRAFLRHGPDVLSETWSHVIPPPMMRLDFDASPDAPGRAQRLFATVPPAPLDIEESEAAAQWAAVSAHRGRLVGDAGPLGLDGLVDGDDGPASHLDPELVEAPHSVDGAAPDADPGPSPAASAATRLDRAPAASRATPRPSPSPRAATMPAIDRAPMPERPWQGVWRSLRAGLRGPVDAELAQPWQRAAVARRRRLLAVVALASALAAATLARAHGGSAHPVLQAAQVALFAGLFAWVAAGCVTAVMGFLVLLRGDRHALSAADAGDGPIPRHVRTALVMPICHEDVATVFGGLRATCESLRRAGALGAFDVFVLSDSSDPAVRAEEREAFDRLRATLGADARLYYRCRLRRTKRKAGNVADFCRRWGRGYDYMVVLDADSVMSGDCLRTLVRLMERHPTAGILQTAPQAVGHATLHARAQQFASRVTGRLFTAGMQYWQLGEAHYWGHNAIIRVKPFMQHCGLARLPGSGALSGDILSHDFVEAALMRRAGWHVWLVPDLVGSYEQQPPNLLAELQRDRRWCQGNLQNARLIAEPGLHGVHRAMLATGAMAYASAPLWLAYVALGALLWWTGDHVFTGPDGRIAMGGAALWAGTLAMLVLPRLLGVFAVLWRGESAQYGGRGALLASAVLEAGLSVLLAPLRMVAHTLFVTGALTGWKLEWKSPPREASDVRWREAAGRFGGVTAVAAAIAGALAAVAPSALVWLAPIGVPLLLAVPFTVLTASASLGARVRDARLLLVPEEADSPAVLRRAWSYARGALASSFA